MLFGPSDVHARQHIGPVAAFRAPCPGVDLQIRVITVRLAIQQRFELFFGGAFGKRFQRQLGLVNHFVVVFGLAQFDQLGIVAQVLFNALAGLDRVDQHLAFAHQFFGAGWLVPQVRVFDHRVKFLKPVAGGFPVHPPFEDRQRFFDHFD